MENYGRFWNSNHSSVRPSLCLPTSVRNYIENKISSIWLLCRHWRHPKLSLWQLTVPPVTTKLSIWRYFDFSVEKDSLRHLLEQYQYFLCWKSNWCLSAKMVLNLQQSLPRQTTVGHVFYKVSYLVDIQRYSIWPTRPHKVLSELRGLERDWTGSSFVAHYLIYLTGSKNAPARWRRDKLACAKLYIRAD